MLISQLYGIILFQVDSRTQRTLESSEINRLDEEISSIYSLTFSKLIKEKVLKKSRTNLNLNVNTVLYIPYYNTSLGESDLEELDSVVITSNNQFEDVFSELEDEVISDEKIEIVLSVLEGSKGIIKPKEREIVGDATNSKSKILEDLEKEIAKFDERGRNMLHYHIYMVLKE